MLEAYRRGDDGDGRMRTVEVNATVERIVFWEMEGVV